MKIKKKLLLAISLMGTLALTGCGKPQPIGEIGCEGGSGGSVCSGSVGVRWTWKSGYPNIDLSDARINLTNSNIGLASNNGTMSVQIKNDSGAVLATHVFNWYGIGNIIYPSDPVAASAWLNNNLQNNNKINFDINGIDFVGNIGANNLIALFEYGSESVGYSDSFYMNLADQNGF